MVASDIKTWCESLISLANTVCILPGESNNFKTCLEYGDQGKLYTAREKVYKVETFKAPEPHVSQENYGPAFSHMLPEPHTIESNLGSLATQPLMHAPQTPDMILPHLLPPLINIIF